MSAFSRIFKQKKYLKAVLTFFYFIQSLKGKGGSGTLVATDCQLLPLLLLSLSVTIKHNVNNKNGNQVPAFHKLPLSLFPNDY